MPSFKQRWKRFTHHWLLPLLALRVFPLFLKALRWLWRGSSLHIDATTQALLQAGKPAIFILWHGQLFGMMHPFWQQPAGSPQSQGCLSHFQPSVMISQSLDGDFMSTVASRIGWHNVIRGAHGRGGKAAAVGVMRALQQPCHAVFVLGDGPRGPRQEVKAGIVGLAARLQIPIIPVAAATPWLLTRIPRSWDAFELPSFLHPIHLALGRPIWVEEGGSVEAVSSQLQAHYQHTQGFYSQEGETPKSH